jgi:antagonist of KipI
MALKMLRAGILTTVQDLGRWGYQRFGVPVSGVMDEVSHRLANWLVGNDETEASVEMTLVGPGFTVTRDTLLAVCGGDFEPRVNAVAMPRARPVLVRAGSALEFGACRTGCRGYLALAGGLHLAPVMGSRSTYLRGGFGGFHGRALRRGDLLDTPALDPARFPSLREKLAGGRARMAYPSWSATERVELLTRGPYSIRFVPGRHWPLFPEEARERFCASLYRIGAQSDRQGYRLTGAAVASAHPIEVISEGVAYGTIQVPPDGDPIVLMASRQTTGGYPRLGEVASVDLPLLAQLAPGATVRFGAISLEEAQSLLLAREREMARTREAILLQARR